MIALVLAGALALPSLPRIPLPRLPDISLPSPSRVIEAIPERLLPRRHDWAQQEWEDRHDPHGEPIAVIEYKQTGPLMLVPVRLNEKGPYWFALDSGSARSVIDSSLMKPAKLGVRNSAALSPAGGLVQRLWATNLDIAGAPVFVREPVAMDLSKTRLPPGVQGLIGRELFDAYVVRINPERRLIAIYQPSAYRAGQATAVPLTSRDGGLYAPVRLAAGGAAPVEKQARIETAWPELLTDDSVRQGQGVRQALIGVSSPEPYWGQVGQLTSVQMGQHTLRDVWGSTGETKVGWGWLSRFIVTFDAPHGRLYLEPTSGSYAASSPPA